MGWWIGSIAVTLVNADVAPLQFLIDQNHSSQTSADFFLENSSFSEHCQNGFFWGETVPQERVSTVNSTSRAALQNPHGTSAS